MSLDRQGVLFDAAGTLYEPSTPVEPLYRMMRRMGLEVELSDLPMLLRRAHAWWSDPQRPLSRTDQEELEERRQYVRMVLEDYGRHRDEALVDTVAEEIYWARWVRVYDDVQPALDALRNGWLLGVLSNGGPSSLDALRFAGLDAYFDVMISGLEVRALKPAPEAYHAALARLDLAPAVAWLVDDSPENVEGASSAGIHAVLLDRYQQYSGWHGQRISSLMELPELLTTDAPGTD